MMDAPPAASPQGTPMTDREPGREARLLRWGYGLLLLILAVGAGRALLRLARTWGWL